ncbi:pyrroloquinoline quinone precursor peptide PqqA [Streptomyces sp. NBC_00847]|nr:pyrroloquinoline quinone precursor peptide PqqA [Streptomyces sp. NBC_00847]MCX4879192.1 pyrroloquinoline quinone precursor peptide PqqA [Streptomyces sp. NBC_00847]
MNEATQQLKPVEQISSKETDRATWQTPDYEIVDTALEVTAYSLSSR